MMNKHRGFTLIELIMVILITGMVAATLVIFLQPALRSYVDTSRRADLTDMADTALRRMAQDIRSAVPNSIRQGGATCFQLVPTNGGGRYRMEVDTTNTTNDDYSKALDTTTTTTVFDVLSPLPANPVGNQTVPVVGDWVVVDNQNGGDVYDGSNRGTIKSIDTPPPAGSGGATVGQHRITLTAPTQFPIGYQAGRFVVVPQNEATVTYTCNGGTLYRVASTTFGPAQCAAPVNTATVNSAIVATGVSNCVFRYTANDSATEQSGYIGLQLSLARGGDTVTLMHGVHVENVP